MESEELDDLDFVDDPLGLLTETEKQLVEYARVGRELDLTAEGDDIAEADSWGSDRTIRADVISTLARCGREDWPVDSTGVRIRGARIIGRLDLEAATVDVPLHLLNSSFASAPTVHDAHLRRLNLMGSRLPGLEASGVKVSGGVYLRHGFQAAGEVILRGAEIGGSLDCSGATFNNDDGNALSCDGMRVTGGVYFRYGFAATGAVSLLNAAIGGDLQCDRGSFRNDDGNALSCVTARVTGNVYMRSGKEEAGGQSGFTAVGPVSMYGTTVGGNLECTGGIFSNPAGMALSCERMRVDGDVFLRSDFTAEGEVRLTGATIGGNLDCTEGRFSNPKRCGLELKRAKAGGLIWADVDVDSTTFVSFRHADVDVLKDAQESWPAEGFLLLDGFTYDRLDGEAPQGPEDRLRWICLDPTYQPQPYEQLITVYRSGAQDDAAHRIAMAKQVARRRSGQLARWQRPFHWLFGAVGYGHKPYRAIWALLVVIMIGSWIFTAALDADAMVATGDSATATSSECTNAYPCVQGLVYSLDVAVPLISFEQHAYWLPDSASTHGKWVQYWMWFSIAAGWTLSTVFVAAMTGLIKRD